MDEKLSKLKEQVSKIRDLKDSTRWGPEYQLWINKTEKLVEEIFGAEYLKIFQQQRTTTTSYIDQGFNIRQYQKELDNRKKVLEGLLAEIEEYSPQSSSNNQNSEIDVIKEIWRKEQALKENLLLTPEVQSIQESLLTHLEKILSKDSIPGLRFRKLRAERRFQTWWTNEDGYPIDDPWGKIEPFLEILKQHEAERTIKHRLEIEGLFVESRSQGEDQHLIIGEKNGMSEKAHVIIDGKTGEIRVESNQEEPMGLLNRIEAFLTLPSGKKIKTTREAIEILE
ncbi:MAG: hypothetical protein Q8L36_01215 [bacterium]|nr:hypothetical protein [bacterium]